MQEPLLLYVDEIDADNIKATVSGGNSFFHNLGVIKLLTPAPASAYLEGKISGVLIMPVGRFICMLVGSTGNRGMILLDLTGKEELAKKMAERLSYADLRDKFMQVYNDIISHPENHHKCELVVGKTGGLFHYGSKSLHDLLFHARHLDTGLQK